MHDAMFARRRNVSKVWGIMLTTLWLCLFARERNSRFENLLSRTKIDTNWKEDHLSYSTMCGNLYRRPLAFFLHF